MSPEAAHVAGESGPRASCPACGARFVRTHTSGGWSWRCSRCGAAVDGDPGRPVRWLYPVREGLQSQDSLEAGEPVTAPTGPPGAPGTEPASPRTLDRYELRGELGRGGMGVVYDAWDPELHRRVALKVLLAGEFAEEVALRRLAGEARTAAALQHPGIVAVYELGERDGHPYFTMERVVGPALSAVLREHGPLGIDEAARVVEEVARAVAFAHARGVVHRDLKPGNVLLDCEGAAHVCDFGLARSLDVESSLSRASDPVGTPAYMPPEVARHDPRIDWTLADVYGIGGILYAALCGRPPAQGATAGQVFDAAIEGRRADLRRLRPEVPPALDAIVGRALHLRPEARYPSAEALAEDLARFRRDEPVSARPEGRIERLGRQLRRRRGPALAGVGLGLAVLALILLSRAWSARQEQARQQAALASWEAVRQRMEAEPARAEEIFQRFVSTPELAGTHALSLAWLTHGDARPPDRTRLYPDPEAPCLDDWARALVVAPDDASAWAAMLRILRWTFQLGEGPQSGPLLDVLEQRASAEQEREIVPIRLSWGLLTGDTTAAATAWTRARELGLPEGSLYADPRRLELLWARGERVATDVLQPWLPPPSEAADPMLLLGRPGVVQRLRLWPEARLDGEAPSTLTPDQQIWTADQPAPRDPPGTSPVWIDLDQDGVVEGYARGGLTELLRVDRVGDRQTVRDAYAALKAHGSVSEVRVAGGDLDGDGTPELAVALCQWGAYDVRVLVPDGRGGLSLRARAHRNAALGLHLLPDPWGPGELIALVETDDYANVAVFGSENPGGPPSALVLRRLARDRLEEVATFTAPPGLRWEGVTSGDVDGDGQRELVVMMGGEDDWRGAAVLWAEPTRDRFTLSLLPGLLPIGLRQLDQDPEDELIATTSGASGEDVWVLGRGDSPRPRPALARVEGIATAPDGLSSSARGRAWQVADLLDGAGLEAQAARILERLAEVSEPGLAEQAAERAAQLRLEAGQPHRAAEDYELAARARSRDALWEGAVRAWLDAAQPERALAAAEAWRAAGGRPGDEIAATLARWEQSRAAAIEAGSSQPLHPGWQVVEPLAFTPSEAGLRLDLANAPGDVAALPARLSGGPIALLADLRLSVLDWGSGLQMDLGDPVGGLKVRVSVVGGGGVNRVAVLCGPRPEPRLHLIQGPSFPVAPTQVPLRIRATWDPETGRWTCLAELPDTGELASHPFELPAPPTSASLQIRPDRNFTGQRLRVVFDRLEIWGAVADPPATDALLRANRALVSSEAAEALALLPPDAALERGIALARLGRPLEAIEALREVNPDSGAFQDRVPLLLRVRRETLAPLLREALGPRFYALYADLWGDVRVRDVDDGTRGALLDDLAGLELAPDPSDPSWPLLAARALLLGRLGQSEQADRALEAWLSRWEALSPTQRAVDPGVASRLYRARALLAAEAGDRERAVGLAARSVGVAPLPELAVDRLEIEPAWRALGVDLAWR